MSRQQPAIRRHQLHDVLGRILDGEDFTTMEAPMEAYSHIFKLLTKRSCDYADVYRFVCDSLSEHIQSKINKAANIRELANIEQNKKSLDVLRTACSYLHRQYIERENAEDVATFCRRRFLEVRHEKVLDDQRWLVEWLQDAIDSVVDGTEPTGDIKKAGQLFLEAYGERLDEYTSNVGDPFIRAAVAHYHEKAKELVAEDDQAAYQAKKQEIVRREAAHGEVYLHESQRRDYLDTLRELFDLGDEKFQRS